MSVGRNFSAMKYQIVCGLANDVPTIDDIDAHFALFLKTFRHLLHRRHYRDVVVMFQVDPYAILLDMSNLSEITKVNFLVELNANLRRRRCIWGASVRYDADRFNPDILVLIKVDRINRSLLQ